MGVVIFLLLMAICITLIYFIHKYFGKNEFYLLAILYSVLSFLMSFKLVKLFGININASVIFSSGNIILLYYFVNRYGKNEIKKLIITILISTFVTGCFLMLNTFMIPSIYDKSSTFYEELILNNVTTIIFYSIALIVTLLLSGYSFTLLKQEKEKKLVKTLFTIVGIMFIDVFIFVYFSYAISVGFNDSLVIALDNYLIKTIIMIIYLLMINKMFSVRKVK